MKMIHQLASANPVLFWMSLFLGISLLCTGIMICLLLIQGDERKKMILSKSTHVAFLGTILVLACGFVYRTFILPHCSFAIELHPLLYLGAVAILFDCSYLHYRKKYGA